MPVLCWYIPFSNKFVVFIKKAVFILLDTILPVLDMYMFIRFVYDPLPLYPGNLQPYGHIESGASSVVRVELPVVPSLIFLESLTKALMCAIMER